MKHEPLAWVLNLDAENELEVAGSYTTSQRMRDIVARESRRLLGTLIAPCDIVLGQGRDEEARGLPGLCWSPTRSGIERLQRAGAQPVETPSHAILRHVNARGFAARVRAELPGNEAFAKEAAEDLGVALELLSRSSEKGWLVRRSFGASGRGRRRIAAGVPDSAERAWLEKSLSRGPLIIEPWVEVTSEHTRSGWVDLEGRIRAAGPCLQATTPEGAWKSTEAAESGQVERREDDALEAAFHAAGRALAQAGYHGPFGIDAFRYRTGGPGSPELLNPLSEINARFTMDWTLGMEDGQRALRETFVR